MPDPVNMQVFQGVTARIFDRLYQEFPNPVTLDVSDFGLAVATELELDEEQTFAALFTAGNTMTFLSTEDFVSVAKGYETLDRNPTEFQGCMLTQKGLAVLGAVPASIDSAIERRPIGRQLSEALQQGARDTVSDVVKSLFSYATKLGIMAAATN